MFGKRTPELEQLVSGHSPKLCRVQVAEGVERDNWLRAAEAYVNTTSLLCEEREREEWLTRVRYEVKYEVKYEGRVQRAETGGEGTIGVTVTVTRAHTDSVREGEREVSLSGEREGKRERERLRELLLLRRRRRKSGQKRERDGREKESGSFACIAMEARARVNDGRETWKET